MRCVKPEVYLVSVPQIRGPEMLDYLRSVGGEEWYSNHEFSADGQELVEFAGRMCYRSWKPGLNPNISRVRTDSQEYLGNILKQAHGSVLEHANYTFVFHNVSRVFTHELVRHRAGVAISQESMRYVRLDEIPMWIPDWAQQDDFVMGEIADLVRHMENFQSDLAEHFGLNDKGTPFSQKKARTSFMRRFAPDGVATSIVWTANVRTLRHVIETRTAPGAEEEIRLVFQSVADLIRAENPYLFGDFEVQENGHWLPANHKV